MSINPKLKNCKHQKMQSYRSYHLLKADGLSNIATMYMSSLLRQANQQRLKHVKTEAMCCTSQCHQHPTPNAMIHVTEPLVSPVRLVMVTTSACTSAPTCVLSQLSVHALLHFARFTSCCIHYPRHSLRCGVGSLGKLTTPFNANTLH